jgi:hypothetical protein
MARPRNGRSNPHHNPGHSRNPVHQHGHAYRGHNYRHMCYRNTWYGWSYRIWCVRFGVWIYWSPVDVCWYRLYSDGIYVPCDDFTDPNWDGR